jgi:hypothetical protein
MLFRLCKEWGPPFATHPESLSQLLPDRWLDDWLLYFEVEPWGCAADDVRTGLEIWHSLNAEGKRLHSPADLMPKWVPKPPMSPEEFKRRMVEHHAARDKSISRK